MYQARTTITLGTANANTIARARVAIVTQEASHLGKIQKAGKAFGFLDGGFPPIVSFVEFRQLRTVYLPALGIDVFAQSRGDATRIQHRQAVGGNRTTVVS